MQLPKEVKLLLVDNKPPFLRMLKSLLADMGIQQVQVAGDLRSGLEAYATFLPDLCMTDIYLGQHDEYVGIRFAEQIRATNAHIPIILMYDYAGPDSYEKCRHLRPSGFISKEISKTKIFQTLDMALSQRDENLPGNKTLSSSQNTLSSHVQHFFFRVGDIFRPIPIDKISYFFADKKLTCARVGNRNYPCNVQLKTLEEELSPLFIRIHKTYLINTSMISSINPGDSTINVANETLPIGYTYRRNFMAGLRLLR